MYLRLEIVARPVVASGNHGDARRSATESNTVVPRPTSVRSVAKREPSVATRSLRGLDAHLLVVSE